MGGTNEMTLLGLRMHISNGDVHVHDDKNSLKFTMKKDSFKSEIEDAFSYLEKNEGVISLEGINNVNLCIGKRDNKHFVFIMNGKDSVKKELETFIKGL